MDFSKFLNKIEKIPILAKLVLILALILIFINVNKLFKKHVEGFTNQKENYLLKTDDLYDDFYSEIYDQLMYSKNKNNFEINKISKHCNFKNKKFLDVGSGTGHHVNLINNSGGNCIGIDKSNAMIAQSRNKFPNNKYLNEDVLKSITFDQNSFDYITCFYFTIYYLRNKQQFFNNCFNWLKPGGKLILHLVDKDNFNPMVPAGDPFIIVNPQNYAEKRITSSKVVFNEFKYDANFNLKNNIGKLKETIKFNNSQKVRENEHVLYMENQKTILRTAQNSGFFLEAKYHMAECEYDYQYIYVLRKPN